MVTWNALLATERCRLYGNTNVLRESKEATASSIPLLRQVMWGVKGGYQRREGKMEWLQLKKSRGRECQCLWHPFVEISWE